jgi:hypothetical protein
MLFKPLSKKAFGVLKISSNLEYKREFFKECENKVDVHVRTLEENNGKISSSHYLKKAKM